MEALEAVWKRVYDWLYARRRLVALKVAVGSALAFSHYYPESEVGLWVNLVWLILF